MLLCTVPQKLEVSKYFQRKYLLHHTNVSFKFKVNLWYIINIYTYFYIYVKKPEYKETRIAVYID